LHFEKKANCPQEAPTNDCTEFQERCMEMVVTQDYPIKELLALSTGQLLYIQIFFMFD
jgi:hypothetical protein